MRAVPTTNRQNAEEFVRVFNEWNEKFGINTPARVTHFVSQLFAESGALAKTEENLNYSADRLLQVFPRYFTRANVNDYARKPEKIANRVYANRMGNGNEASGDGWKYRGRGLIMITGKQNYQSYQSSEFCTGNLMGHPEWLSKSPGHTKSAMWFWWKNRLNAIADEDKGQRVLDGENIVTRITLKVNGGLNGIADRKYYYRKFRKEFSL